MTNPFDDLHQRAEKTLKAIRGGQCGCHHCIADRGHMAMHMVLCRTCGNKRCPKASDHRLDCTDSNEPGQPGSVY